MKERTSVEEGSREVDVFMCIVDIGSICYPTKAAAANVSLCP